MTKSVSLMKNIAELVMELELVMHVMEQGNRLVPWALLQTKQFIGIVELAMELGLVEVAVVMVKSQKV